MPALKSIGVKKFAVFVPASGQVGALTAFAAPLVKNLGMELAELIQIPPTAVEFTQFVLQAQKGAEGAVLGLPGNVANQIIDAMDSLNSDLKTRGQLGDLLAEGGRGDAREHREEHGVHRRGSAIRQLHAVQVAHPRA